MTVDSYLQAGMFHLMHLAVSLLLFSEQKEADMSTAKSNDNTANTYIGIDANTALNNLLFETMFGFLCGDGSCDIKRCFVFFAFCLKRLDCFFLNRFRHDDCEHSVEKEFVSSMQMSRSGFIAMMMESNRNR